MVEKVRAAVTEKTAVSLGVVLALVSLSAGLIAWTHSVEARVAKSEFVGADLEEHRKTDQALLQSIDSRLSKIEGKLGIH